MKVRDLIDALSKMDPDSDVSFHIPNCPPWISEFGLREVSEIIEGESR